MLRFLTVSAFFVAFATSVAQADTILVPADHARIQDAIEAAQSGDEIVVSRGLYEEALVFAGKSGITLRGQGKVTVDAGGAATSLTVIDSTGVTVERLSFEGTSDNGAWLLFSDAVTLVRCRFVGALQDGIHVDRCTNVLIERCIVDRCFEDGIEFEDDVAAPANSIVVRNQVRRAGDDGIEVLGSEHLVERNRISRCGNTGVFVNGTDNDVVRNSIAQTSDEGIQFRGDRNLAEKNRIRGTGDDGIDLEGNENRVVGNRIAGPNDDGIEIEPEPGFTATDNVLERNRILRCEGSGIHLFTGGNTLTKNVARGSDEFDLLDEAGGNTLDGNRFGTESVP